MRIYSSKTLARRGSILFLTATAIIFGLNLTWHGPSGNNRFVFLLLNGLLFLYLSWEISRLARKEKWRVLIHPVVLASLYHFMGSYLFPDLRHTVNFDWEHTRGYFLLSPNPYKWLNAAMLGVLLAAFAMWRGYRSHSAVRIAGYVRRFLLRRRLLRKGFDLNFSVVFLLIALAVSAVFLNVSLGVFGYSSGVDSLQQTMSLRSFIKLGTSCGPLVLLVMSIAVFSKRYHGTPIAWLLFSFIFFFQILLGFLSGFKSQVVMPVMITGFGYYISRHRIPLKLILLSFLMLVAAYQVIQPFRELRYNDINFNNRSISSIADTMITAASDSSLHKKHSFNWREVVARQDLLTFTAISIAFKNKLGLPTDAPDFVKGIILSPLLAFIPRFIWRSKPIQNLGYLFNVNVLGASPSTVNSVGMGPISYCYFGGGYLMVFIVFWLIGLIQRVTYDTFVDESFGGWIIYLALLPSLVVLQSNVGAMLTGFFRIVPFVILAQYLLIKKGISVSKAGDACNTIAR